MIAKRKLFARLLGLLLSISLMAGAGLTAMASSGDYLNGLSGGVSAIIDPSATNTTQVIQETAERIGNPVVEEEEEEAYDKVMANVTSALNIRSQADEGSDIVGRLYKDCGGTILERKDGWTKIQSGNVIGWANDDYLLFDEDAKELAGSVGKMVAYMDDVLRIRQEPDKEAALYGVLPKGEAAEVLEVQEDGWVCIDYEGENGYVSSEYVTLDFLIDHAETLEEIKAREEAEEAARREAKRHVNYGEYTTDADTKLLLAALIQCEAGSESYEGKVAVGAVVMNRVRSSAYPNTIHGVIYASGQFTPAMNGKVNQVYESGKIQEECIRAAEDALSGTSPVGDLTHFRRNNGREGLVIGHHVFY